MAPYEHCLSSICTALESAAGVVGRYDCSCQGFYQDTTSHGAGACGSPTAWVGSNATDPGSGRLTILNDVLHLRRGDPARAALVKLSEPGGAQMQHHLLVPKAKTSHRKTTHPTQASLRGKQCSGRSLL